MSKIRVLLTDDHTLFRQGIHTLLAEERDIDVVGEAANGTESVEKISSLRPDVVLMDIGMPGLSSFEATRQIKKIRPETKILFLTMYDDEDYLVECMEVGGSGYVLKDSPAPQLLAAIRDISAAPTAAAAAARAENHTPPSSTAPARTGSPTAAVPNLSTIGPGRSRVHGRRIKSVRGPRMG